jgi:predicted nucleotidyltransferase
MDKSEVINIVRQYKLLLQEHFDLDQVFLFGSYARDASRADSDIDVAIVVKYLSDDYFKTTPLIWKLRRQIDHRIEPILIEKNNDKSGFIDEIRKHGIEII